MPNKSQVEHKVKALISEKGLDFKDVVVTGPSAVFALAGVAEDYSNTIVVGTTATNYARLRKEFKEVNGYDGIYLDANGVMVQEGLPLATETFSRLKCISLQTLNARLALTNKPAHETLDAWIRAELAKKLRVKPELRLGYLTLDEQLFFQDILEHRGRELDEEEQFVLEIQHIDWSHQMSDSSGVWRAGEAHRKTLTEKAEDKFGKGTTLAKKFADICQWGYNGYTQLHEMYPWLAGYNAGKHQHHRGLMAAAMEGVSEEYIATLRGWAVKLDMHFKLLPKNFYQGYYVFTDATPPLFKMRELAKDTGIISYYGIAVREDARAGLNETLKHITQQMWRDMDRFSMFHKYTESLYQVSLLRDDAFSDLTAVQLYGIENRTYRFLVKF